MLGEFGGDVAAGRTLVTVIHQGGLQRVFTVNLINPLQSIVGVIDGDAARQGNAVRAVPGVAVVGHALAVRQFHRSQAVSRIVKVAVAETVRTGIALLQAVGVIAVGRGQRKTAVVGGGGGQAAQRIVAVGSRGGAVVVTGQPAQLVVAVVYGFNRGLALTIDKMLLALQAVGRTVLVANRLTFGIQQGNAVTGRIVLVLGGFAQRPDFGAQLPLRSYSKRVTPPLASVKAISLPRSL